MDLGLENLEVGHGEKHGRPRHQHVQRHGDQAAGVCAMHVEEVRAGKAYGRTGVGALNAWQRSARFYCGPRSHGRVLSRGVMVLEFGFQDSPSGCWLEGFMSGGDGTEGWLASEETEQLSEQGLGDLN